MASTHDHDLVILLNTIAISCKLITSAVQRAGVAKLYGLAGEVNSTGDDQKKLDVLSNEMMINALVHSGVCSVLVSEENEDPIMVPLGKQGKFCVAFDRTFPSVTVKTLKTFCYSCFLGDSSTHHFACSGCG
jgi:fructose-1,6-bisphosphatase I